ncbi:unnamed protein product, partial [Medioppia subpectinata]
MIRSKENTHLFSCDTFNEMIEWLNCLQMVAFGANHSFNNINTIHSKSQSLDSNANQFNTNSSPLNQNKLSDAQSEENLLYSSVDGPDVYRVKLIDSETSIRCGLRSGFDSNLTLIVTSVNISLSEEGKVLYTWPYRHIRRYGCTKDGFSLEAGRKCASGEGLFSFITKDGNSIFQAVATHVNSLKASRHITDEQITGINTLGAINISPKLNSKEYAFSSSHFNSNNESKPSLPSTSPPLSMSFSSKLNYFATNSSLLPSTKIPESVKRHSIQPPKSPQIIAKQSLNRVTSVSTANTIAGPGSDPKPKASPPVSKPPRKSKESKTGSESDEPVFASREEVLNTPPNMNFIETYRPLKDELLYDEPADLITNTVTNQEEQHMKSPFCPSPPPVNQTVSKLTSVLKMMFTGNAANQIQTKYKDNKANMSARNSTSSSTNNSGLPSPVGQTAPQSLDAQEVAYSEVSDFDIDDKSIKNNITADSNHYSKILNDSLEADDCEHEYANVIHQDLNNLNKI